MRAFATVVLVLSTALLTTACGGPDDPTKSLAEACERQIEEIAEEESGTPTAKSSDERLEAVTLVECAGQKTRVVAADAEGEGSSEGDAKGEGEMPPAEDPTGDLDSDDDGEIG